MAICAPSETDARRTPRDAAGFRYDRQRCEIGTGDAARCDHRRWAFSSKHGASGRGEITSMSSRMRGGDLLALWHRPVRHAPDRGHYGSCSGAQTDVRRGCRRRGRSHFRVDRTSAHLFNADSHEAVSELTRPRLEIERTDTRQLLLERRPPRRYRRRSRSSQYAPTRRTHRSRTQPCGSTPPRSASRPVRCGRPHRHQPAAYTTGNTRARVCVHKPTRPTRCVRKSALHSSRSRTFSP